MASEPATIVTPIAVTGLNRPVSVLVKMVKSAQLIGLRRVSAAPHGLLTVSEELLEPARITTDTPISAIANPLIWRALESLGQPDGSDDRGECRGGGDHERDERRRQVVLAVDDRQLGTGNCEHPHQCEECNIPPAGEAWSGRGNRDEDPDEHERDQGEPDDDELHGVELGQQTCDPDEHETPHGDDDRQRHMHPPNAVHQCRPYPIDQTFVRMERRPHQSAARGRTKAGE